MRIGRPSAVLMIGCVVAVTGCGSGATKPSTASAANNDEASKPPNQILADTSAAIRAAHGYAMHGTIIQNHQRLTLHLTAASATAVNFAFSIGSSTAEVIDVPAGSYLRANAAFWTSQAGAQEARFANHWIRVPSANARGVAASLGPLAPATLSRCLLEDHGSLSIAGQITIDGRPAILIKDAGNLPGSTPSVLTVAATGAPYPLRYSATGDQRAGGRIDVCNDGKASNSRGTITFSRFGHIPPIQAPKGAEQTAPGPTT